MVLQTSVLEIIRGNPLPNICRTIRTIMMGIQIVCRVTSNRSYQHLRRKNQIVTVPALSLCRNFICQALTTNVVSSGGANVFIFLLFSHYQID